MAVFMTFLPRLPEVRKATVDDTSMAGDVRMGELMGSAVALGVGGILSALTKSLTPLYVAGATAVLLVSIYEYTLRADRPMEP